MYDSILSFDNNLVFPDGSHISIYNKQFKWSKDDISELMWNAMTYERTRSYYIFLHNPDQKYDSEYEFRLVTDEWQKDKVLETLRGLSDVSFDSVRGLFAKLSESVNSVSRVATGAFGNHLVTHGTYTTELLKQYGLLNTGKEKQYD